MDLHSQRTALVVGLTGGMGCGKSTAGKMFAELGWSRMDSDEIIRDEILTDPSVISAARALFGPSATTTGGHLDRRFVAEQVFRDKEALAQWESILHPRLFSLWKERFSREKPARWIVEVPLLFEKRLENWFDFIVCVATTSDLQLVRLAERGMSHALAEQRISKQLPLVFKIEHSHFVLSNDGSPDFLRDQVVRLSARLTSRR